MNTHFGRVGRALLRPIIWRQMQLSRQCSLTRRLRWSLAWFCEILGCMTARHVPYVRAPVSERMFLYTDAESQGHLADFMVINQSIFFWVGQAPRRLQNMLLPRKTQIIAYELMAAVACIFVVLQIVGHGVPVIHFIDATVALNIVLKGSAKQGDLNAICGHLWPKRQG